VKELGGKVDLEEAKAREQAHDEAILRKNKISEAFL